jgi:hypothetical protein
MASDYDAKESLLPDMKDHSHLNEKNNLQRRRENGEESPVSIIVAHIC